MHFVDFTILLLGSVFMGFFYAACALGPALGFMIGKPVLNTYVDLVLVSGVFIYLVHLVFLIHGAHGQKVYSHRYVTIERLGILYPATVESSASFRAAM